MDIILYSTGCPKCLVLKNKMREANINYKEVSDIAVMEEKGFMQVPMLEVNGETMNYVGAVNWINNTNKEDK